MTITQWYISKEDLKKESFHVLPLCKQLVICILNGLAQLKCLRGEVNNSTSDSKVNSSTLGVGGSEADFT